MFLMDLSWLQIVCGGWLFALMVVALTSFWLDMRQREIARRKKQVEEVRSALSGSGLQQVAQITQELEDRQQRHMRMLESMERLNKVLRDIRTQATNIEVEKPPPPPTQWERILRG